jgi:hypothetical protein
MPKVSVRGILPDFALFLIARQMGSSRGAGVIVGCDNQVDETLVVGSKSIMVPAVESVIRHCGQEILAALSRPRLGRVAILFRSPALGKSASFSTPTSPLVVTQRERSTCHIAEVPGLSSQSCASGSHIDCDVKTA